MKKQNKRANSNKANSTPSNPRLTPGCTAEHQGQQLRSFQVGGLPLINHILQRMNLRELLQQHLPPDDPRTRVPTSLAITLLVRNLLVSREPIYGVGEWAARYAPDLVGLTPAQLARCNDDRVGRCLDRLFDAGHAPLLAIVRQVIEEFGVRLDELHNDGTTVSFFGAYADAAAAGTLRGHATPAITFGHAKARPDLKQLLYTLTVSDDGGVPVYVSTHSGNTTDDTTHLETWKLMCELTGRPDFLYVADSKLATRENLSTIADQQGRFVTVLPRTRGEDQHFRQRLESKPSAVGWRDVLEVTDEEGEVVDRYRVCTDASLTSEGYRLFWYHSLRKQQSDAAWRARNVQRAMQKLVELRERMLSPKTRLRERDKVQGAVDAVLEELRVSEWLSVEIVEQPEEKYKQATRGRPGKNTQYVKEVKMRYTLHWEVDAVRVSSSSASDGVFPLITNDVGLSAESVLAAYKRQPIIEKRFSQLKTDFEVAPVYLKNIGRIVGFLTVYFFALLVQTLLERELRRGLSKTETGSLPLYPEGRACRCPTARRLLDVFEGIQRHELRESGESQVLVTKLTRLQREVLKLLGVPHQTYGR